MVPLTPIPVRGWNRGTFDPYRLARATCHLAGRGPPHPEGPSCPVEALRRPAGPRAPDRPSKDPEGVGLSPERSHPPRAHRGRSDRPSPRPVPSRIFSTLSPAPGLPIRSPLPAPQVHRWPPVLVLHLGALPAWLSRDRSPRHRADLVVLHSGDLPASLRIPPSAFILSKVALHPRDLPAPDPSSALAPRSAHRHGPRPGPFRLSINPGAPRASPPGISSNPTTFALAPLPAPPGKAEGPPPPICFFREGCRPRRTDFEWV
jgi:hypothetical protein